MGPISVVVIIGLLFCFYAFVRMMQLSIQIEQSRKGEAKPSTSIVEELAKGVSNHALPGPFFREFHDNEEIWELIKKRNWMVAMFWMTVLAAIVLSLVLKSPTPPIGMEKLK